VLFDNLAEALDKLTRSQANWAFNSDIREQLYARRRELDLADPNRNRSEDTDLDIFYRANDWTQMKQETQWMKDAQAEIKKLMAMILNPPPPARPQSSRDPRMRMVVTAPGDRQGVADANPLQ
jgi:hypothetical protein